MVDLVHFGVDVVEHFVLHVVLELLEEVLIRLQVQPRLQFLEQLARVLVHLVDVPLQQLVVLSLHLQHLVVIILYPLTLHLSQTSLKPAQHHLLFAHYPFQVHHFEHSLFRIALVIYHWLLMLLYWLLVNNLLMALISCEEVIDELFFPHLIYYLGHLLFQLLHFQLYIRVNARTHLCLSYLRLHLFSARSMSRWRSCICWFHIYLRLRHQLRSVVFGGTAQWDAGRQVLGIVKLIQVVEELVHILGHLAYHARKIVQIIYYVVYLRRSFLEYVNLLQ